MTRTESGVGSHKETDANAALSSTALAQASNFDHSMPIIVEDTQQERVEGSVGPTGGVTGNGPYEFVLPPVEQTFLLLGNLSLYCKARVMRENDAPLIGTDVVAPVNGLGTAMWEHTEVSVNDYTLGGASATNSHYKGYLETVLSYDATSKDTHLRAQLFSMDTPGHYADMTENGENAGFRDRFGVVRESQTFDMVSPLTADFLRTDKHLCPGNKLSVKLYRARDAFLLNTVQNRRFHLKILELKLYYQRVRLRENIPIPRVEKYLCTKTEMKRFPIPIGMTRYNFTLHHGGKMPKSIILAQVLTAAAEGSFANNPFYLQHFNINTLALRVNGRQVPSDALQPDFNNEPPLVNRSYVHMFMNTGAYRLDRGNCITLPAFQNGCTVFPFDLAIDMCNGYHLHAAREGTISVEIGWAQALANPITLLAHCSYDEVHVRRDGMRELRSEEV